MTLNLKISTHQIYIVKKLVDEKEINSIKDLDIQTNRADVKVEEHDSDKIKVEIYSNYAKKYSIVDEEKIKVLLEENKKAFSLLVLNQVL